MSSNYQRALDLADHIADVDETPRELVKQLHQYGLLAPDLPTAEPEDHEDGVIYEFRTCMARPELGDVWMFEGLRAYKPDEARRIALELLAAANHAEVQANE